MSNLTAEADDEVTLYAVWSQHVWTVAEALDADGLAFTTGGDEPTWFIDDSTAHSGVVSMRSGAIGDSQTNWIETVVSGPGAISFWWKASGECQVNKKGVVIELYDYAEFTIDGVSVAEIGAETDWSVVTQSVESAGLHTLRWMYHKDEEGTDGDDCAWLDQVVWTLADPIPDLGDEPTVAEITNVLTKAEDPKLAEKITNETEYVAFREWSGNVKQEKGGEDAASTVRRAHRARPTNFAGLAYAMSRGCFDRRGSPLGRRGRKLL